MMRILHILDHSLPQQSGYVFRTLGLLRAQKARGWETDHLTTPRHPDGHGAEETIDGWPFYRTPVADHALSNVPLFREWREMAATRSRLEQLVDQLRPDILHAHSPLLTGLPALSVARRRNLPLVYEVRAFWEDAAVDHGRARPWGPRYRATRGLESYLLRRADGVVTICEGLRGDILARGIAPEKVAVVPNAVDLTSFQDMPPRDHDLAKHLGLDPAATIGFIGSFYAYEGLDLLIEAMAGLRGEHAAMKLLLVGGGPEEARLKALARAKGLEDRVIFTGRVPHQEVQRYYGLLDVFVYPRHRMRLTDLVTPLKPLEAMAQSKLVLGSDVGGHKELIEHGKTGYLFPADDKDGLSQALHDLFARRAAWASIRATARTFVERERNWDASAAHYEPLYKLLIQRISADPSRG